MYNQIYDNLIIYIVPCFFTSLIISLLTARMCNVYGQAVCLQNYWDAHPKKPETRISFVQCRLGSNSPEWWFVYGCFLWDCLLASSSGHSASTSELDWISSLDLKLLDGLCDSTMGFCDVLDGWNLLRLRETLSENTRKSIENIPVMTKELMMNSWLSSLQKLCCGNQALWISIIFFPSVTFNTALEMSATMGEPLGNTCIKWGRMRT